MLCEARHHLRRARLPLDLVAQIHGLPGADHSLVKPFAPAVLNLRMNGNGSHRLNRTGKTQILAEAQHRFHARGRVGGKIHLRQQFAAVGRCLFHRGGKAFAALAKRSLLPGSHKARLQLRRCPGTIGHHHQRTIFKPAKKGAVGSRAQRPGPVVLLCIHRARF